MPSQKGDRGEPGQNILIGPPGEDGLIGGKGEPGDEGYEIPKLKNNLIANP